MGLRRQQTELRLLALRQVAYTRAGIEIKLISQAVCITTVPCRIKRLEIEQQFAHPHPGWEFGILRQIPDPAQHGLRFCHGIESKDAHRA